MAGVSPEKTSSPVASVIVTVAPPGVPEMGIDWVASPTIDAQPNSSVKNTMNESIFGLIVIPLNAGAQIQKKGVAFWLSGCGALL